ncbi:MAG: tryptophan-rich sensory protein [Acidobacteriota bacterium]
MTGFEVEKVKAVLVKLMTVTYAVLIATGICFVAAAFEGLCAGKNVKAHFAKLKWPRSSPPLWVWYIIGVGYYAVFWFALYRLLRIESSVLRTATLVLIPLMMALNGFWNYLFFRAQNLFLSFVGAMIAPIPDVALFLCVLRLDTTAAWALVPYLIYRLYSLWWGYGLWKMNRAA